MQIKVNGHNIKAQILPMDKPTLDETLETFSFAVVVDQAMPYAPCQSVQVITDSGEKINLFLVTDSVELFSVSPRKYKHNLICTQNTRELSKHLVRNTVFSQPSNPVKESYNAATFSLANRVNDPSGNYKSGTHGTYQKHSGFPALNSLERMVELKWIDVTIGGSYSNAIREKIKDAYFELKCSVIWCAQGQEDIEIPSGTPSEWRSPNSSNDILTQTSNSTTWSFKNGLILYCEKSDGTAYTETITPSSLGISSTWYLLNKKVRIPRVKELASQGYVKFSVKFPDNTADFISGTAYPWRGAFYLMLSFQPIITLETYIYSVYDVLDRLRIRQRKQRYDWNTLVYEPDLFELPNTDPLISLLINTPAPNFVFTQCTMYECIAEVFRLFDAIFIMDENKVLGIEYFNDLSGRDVTSSLKKVGENLSVSEDKYTNGLLAYYQDGRTVETFPSGNSTVDSSYAPIRCKALGVPTEQSDFAFITPHRIDNVQHCYIRFANESGQKIGITSDFEFGTGSGYVAVGDQDVNKLIGNPLLDIAHWVVYEDLWTQLPAVNTFPSGESPFTRYQINTLSFAKGSNEIKVSYSFTGYRDNDTGKDLIPNKMFAFDMVATCALCAMLGINTGNSKVIVRATLSDWRQVSMKIVYMTTVDGRVKVESIDRKYDGETLVDQYNGAVDLNKMGVNILGLSLKLGNPTLTVTQRITKWANRIKTGDIYYYPNRQKMWIANVITYTLLGNGNVQATIQFVQNFNALALRTRLLREKRMSNISNELTVKSEENIVEYCYVTVSAQGSQGGSPNYAVSTRTPLAIKRTSLLVNFAGSLGVAYAGSIPIENLLKENGLEVATFQKTGEITAYFLPLIKYGSGNSICFEMSFNDPISAGNQTTAVTDGNAWYYSNYIKYFTKAIKYTDSDGFASHVSVRMVPAAQMLMDQTFPEVGWLGEAAFTITDYAVFKQPNEIFALNYQLTFLPYDSTKDFIGTEFINNNYMVNGVARSKKDLYVYYSDTYLYSVLDTKGNGDNTGGFVLVNLVEMNADEDNFERIVLTISENIEARSFAVCDTKGNILFASNRGIHGNKIYLTFTNHTRRVDSKVLSDL